MVKAQMALGVRRRVFCTWPCVSVNTTGTWLPTPAVPSLSSELALRRGVDQPDCHLDEGCLRRQSVEGWGVSVATPKEDHMSRYMILARSRV